MITLTTILQSTAASAGGSAASFWIMMILIFAVMWLFMIRPQRKQQKELEAFRNSLKKGDKIVTIGGIYGTIDSVDDNNNTALIKVDGDVKLRVAKSSLVKDFSQAQQQ
ncbi:MAG: preprotein translocase subunit YajC [Bacteroidales bacterium]|nr:preprotein translocase subunit YajC [Bacteroidales bacterium]